MRTRAITFAVLFAVISVVVCREKRRTEVSPIPAPLVQLRPLSPPPTLAKPDPLPDDVIRAWKQAGAEIGQTTSPAVGPSQPHSVRAIVEFRFPRPAGLRLATLPAPDRPFGLVLEGTTATDAHLTELAGFKNLAALVLRGTAIADAGLKELATLTNLTSLNLNDTRVTDAGLKELARFTSLAWLDFTQTRVTHAGLRVLAPLKSLDCLVLDDPLTDSGLRAVREAGLLHALPVARSATDTRPESSDDVVSFDLSASLVTADGLKELLPLTNLDTLKLSDPQVTHAGMTRLSPLKRLTTIVLNPARVTDGVLGSLRDAGLLHALPITTAAKNQRPRRPEEVIALDLSDTQVTDAGLKQLTPLTNLTSLTLSGRPVTDAGLTGLAPLAHLTALYVADTRVTDAGLKELVPLAHLSALGLSRTRVTDAGLKELVPLRNLTLLYLAETRVTAAGVAELQKALPNCRITH